MSNFKDLTGAVFNNLTVLRKDELLSKEKHRTYWLCKCKCGQEKSIRSDSLISGKTKSCGCDYQRKYIGEKFGKLIPIKQVEPPNKDLKHRYFLCSCECGSEIVACSVNLSSGNTKSCGCIKQQVKIGNKYGYLTVIDKDIDKTEYSNHKNVFWKCSCICGNISSVRTTDLQNEHVISCGCISSKGELKILKSLQDLKYSFKSQYSFPDLYGDEGLLRFDFAILDKKENPILLIEYQGIQHYKPIEYFGGSERFIKQQAYDNKKRNYCKLHFIPLLEISYKEELYINNSFFKEKIDQILWSND